jgi:hypothetical protein
LLVGHVVLRQPFFSTSGSGVLFGKTIPMSWLSGSKTLFRTNTMPKRSAAQISSADVKPKGKAGKATAVAAVRPSKREPESESDEHDAEADADDALLDQMAHQGNDDYSGSESEDDGMESVSDIIARLQRERRAAKKNKSSTKQSVQISRMCFLLVA